MAAREPSYSTRQSLWAAGRWWLLAGGVSLVAVVTLWFSVAAAWLGVAAGGVWAGWRLRRARWWRWKVRTLAPLTIPAGAAVAAVGWWRLVVTAVFVVYAVAVWKTLQWQAVTIRLTADRMVVTSGIVTTRTATMQNRQLVQAQRGETLPGKLVGYSHIDLETAAQVEFAGRIPFAPAELYDIIVDPEQRAAAIRTRVPE